MRLQTFFERHCERKVLPNLFSSTFEISSNVTGNERFYEALEVLMFELSSNSNAIASTRT